MDAVNIVRRESMIPLCLRSLALLDRTVLQWLAPPNELSLEICLLCWIVGCVSLRPRKAHQPQEGHPDLVPRGFVDDGSASVRGVFPSVMHTLESINQRRLIWSTAGSHRVILYFHRAGR